MKTIEEIREAGLKKFYRYYKNNKAKVSQNVNICYMKRVHHFSGEDAKEIVTIRKTLRELKKNGIFTGVYYELLKSKEKNILDKYNKDEQKL